MGELRAVVDRFWDRFEAKDYDGATGLMAAHCVSVLPDGVEFKGPEQIVGMLRGYAEAFPDMRHEVIDSVESDGKIAVRLRVTATHTGTLHTPNGDIPPTGQQIIWQAVDFIKVADGKLVSWHAYYDQLAFLAQLGLLPESVTA